jgi:hypothetical protein
MAEEYEEKIFRLAFKKDSHSHILEKETDIIKVVVRGLELREPVLIHPANEDAVLEQINFFVDVQDFQGDEAFNDRLNQLDKLNPKDPMVEQIEKESGYSNYLTREIINTVDKLLDTCVFVSDENPNSSSEEEGPDDVKHTTRIGHDIRSIIRQPFQKNKVTMNAPTKIVMRRFLLTDLARLGDFKIVASDKFQSDFNKFLQSSKGGTNRRKSTKSRKNRL